MSSLGVVYQHVNMNICDVHEKKSDIHTIIFFCCHCPIVQ